MPDIELKDIDKSYGSTRVLNDLSLTIRQGEFLTLLGASGCGKSTLLKLLAGLELPDRGSIRRGDSDMLALSPGERDCAMVFQSYALYPHMTVGDNICTPLYMRQLAGWQRLPGVRLAHPQTRRTRAAAHQEGRRVAEMLGIGHLWDRKPAALSGGQRQRVALARAMVRKPTLFLFDEPLSNLDANLRQALRAEIRALHDKLGVTFVYVTHDQHEAMSMSDRVAVMKEGRILQLDTPQTIYADPDHLDVARFVGAPRINVIASGLVPAGILSVPPAATWIAFRPQEVMLDPAPGRVPLAATVQMAEYTGAERMATLVLRDGTTVMAVLDCSTPLARGTELMLHIPQSALLAFDAQGQRVELHAAWLHAA